MTDFTELWKKGELSNGWYYTQLKEGTYAEWQKPVIINYYYEYPSHFETHNSFVEKVLAPVPLYAEWKAADNRILENGLLLIENAKLKKLLNKAFMYVHQDFIQNLRVGYTPVSSFLIRDIIEALKDYRRMNAKEVLIVEDKKDE